ncbi:MAG: hypothetical protein Q9201_006528 [Fulgogasparrea decipioides]
MAESAANDAFHATSTWVPEPNGRGTWSLLSTCIVTISLCVWSAVHLNIPQHQKPHSQYWRKWKWLLLGLFAPELVAYVAWQQWQEARSLQRHVRAIYDQKEVPSGLHRIRRYFRFQSGEAANKKSGGRPAPPSPRVKNIVRSEWELVHGFYVLMGGFALASPNDTFLPDGLTRAPLTPSGLRFLLQHEPEALPDISAEQIRDKSKADGLKKTVVCIQALWFCIQCITRLSQRLPVSLLEINTMGHALCTLVIYLLWWHKPFDVEEPTLLTDSALYPILAYMWMSSRDSARNHCSHDMPDGLQDEFQCIWPFREPVLSELAMGKRNVPPDVLRSWAVARNQPSLTDNGNIIRYWPRKLNASQDDVVIEKRPAYVSAVSQVQCRLRSLFPLRIITSRVPAGFGVRKTAISHLSSADINRWALALMAIERYQLEDDLRFRHQTATSGRFFNISLNMRAPFLDALQNNSLNPRLEFRSRNAVFTLAPSGVFPGFAISGALYGGLHLAGWAAPFSSPLEELLWKISAMSVTCTGIVFALLALIITSEAGKRALSDLPKIVTGRPLKHSSRREELKAYALAVGIGLGGCIFVPCLPLVWILYLLSRGYLVFESFRNIAYLPSASFDTPTWPSYFPHIT